MSYSNWPTLSRSAVIEEYPCEPSDPTVRSKTSDGRPLARAGTGPILRTWRFTLRYLSLSDRTLLDTFQFTTVKIGGEPFNWTEPLSGATHVVRLARPMIFTCDRNRLKWRTEVTLDEEPGY
jgi:hypothetical protein